MAPFKEAKLLSATTYFGSTTATIARPIFRPLNREAFIVTKPTKERLKDIFDATSGDDPFVQEPQTPLPKTQTTLSNAECTLNRLFHHLS
ncbi:hypothetical protein CCHR01_08931 [Colletotrichum chrysophilum]|uniref:Uncharacterized protein n=1 Tax=Colletotrichum chrysophilum TaxID=1836956 RepID=A0AAD9AIZ1_9PEZI|nr:hypothetical protein CCHR01_08931 [Colletotrichum chrysophilum]